MAEGKLDLKGALVGGAVGGVLGFSTGYFLKGPYTRWRQKVGFDDEHQLHHASVGTSIAMLGGMVAPKNLSPIISGFGIGLAAEDYAHHLGLVGWPKVEVFGDDDDEDEYVTEDQGEDEVEDDEGSEFVVVGAGAKKTWHTIPNWPSSIRNHMMAGLLRKMCYEDCHHPAVRYHMENVIRDNVMDGRDKENLLPALQTGFQDTIIYVHDEARDVDGSRSVDRFAHANVTLPRTKYNPEGTGMGDCDCVSEAFCSMCLSVGIDDVCLVLVDQGRGYSHVAPGWIQCDGKPKSIDDIIFMELTENRDFGWTPRARKFGFVLL